MIQFSLTGVVQILSPAAAPHGVKIAGCCNQGIYERLAKMKEQGYLTTIDLPALPAPADDSDVED